MKHIIENFEQLKALEGKEIGTSDWQTITQEQIDKFADVTLDHQWIHTDVERARVESPFHSTIAHGYLTISLLPYHWEQVIDVQNLKMQINYGIEKLKFGQPVLTGSDVRVHADMLSVTDLRGVVKASIGIRMEIRDCPKPAFEGTIIFVYHFNK
ncbi:MAG: MaoC family dehydratase [Salinivirgaceae bacterium]|nr:MaoC family dehydratase [Salinivirgaceae bacterium]